MANITLLEKVKDIDQRIWYIDKITENGENIQKN